MNIKIIFIFPLFLGKNLNEHDLKIGIFGGIFFMIRFWKHLEKSNT